MNAGVVKLGLFLRDLLGLVESPEEDQQIFLGRTNIRREVFTDLQVAVDTLGTGVIVARSNKFDHVTEIITYTNVIRLPTVISFYGNGAHVEANKFALLKRSQAGYELQRDLFLTVYDFTAITDVKSLTGEQYSERVEIECNIRYNESFDVPTLRIDTSGGTVITDNGDTGSWQTL